MCGVYSGLFLPRSVSAIWVASRPSVLPSASTTYQRWVTSLGLAFQVFIATAKRRTRRPPARDCTTHQRELVLNCVDRSFQTAGAQSGHDLMVDVASDALGRGRFPRSY